MSIQMYMRISMHMSVWMSHQLYASSILTELLDTILVKKFDVTNLDELWHFPSQVAVVLKELPPHPLDEAVAIALQL